MGARWLSARAGTILAAVLLAAVTFEPPGLRDWVFGPTGDVRIQSDNVDGGGGLASLPGLLLQEGRRGPGGGAAADGDAQTSRADGSGRAQLGVAAHDLAAGAPSPAAVPAGTAASAAHLANSTAANFTDRLLSRISVGDTALVFGVTPSRQGTVEDGSPGTVTRVGSRGVDVQVNKRSIGLPLRSVVRGGGDRGWLGCTECCTDGREATECLDVEACAAQGPMRGRYAFVFSYVKGRYNPPFFDNLESVRAQATANGMDMILFITKAELLDLSERDRELIDGLKGVKVTTVDWQLPPGMLYRMRPKQYARYIQGPWCGRMDLIRLHAFGLPYDAVAYYDSDIELQGDVMPVLRCAATGRLLTTSGPSAPLNMGFFAVRPDPRLFDAAVRFSQTATFTNTSGWADTRPMDFTGGDCGQGFLMALFFPALRNRLADEAFEAAGMRAGDIRASQLDRCIWNYQTWGGCGPRWLFNCSLVRAHHKPPIDDGHSCVKRAEPSTLFHLSSWSCKPHSAVRGARPGEPCIKSFGVYPYVTYSRWRVQLGKSVLSTLTPRPRRNHSACQGFKATERELWCLGAMRGGEGGAALGLAYGLRGHGAWSQGMLDSFGVPARLHSCLPVPPHLRPAGEEGFACSEASLDAELRHRGPQSTHVRIDWRGAGWSGWKALEHLVSRKDLHKIRTIDMELQFIERDWHGSVPPTFSPEKAALRYELSLLEALLRDFSVVGSTLESDREALDLATACPTRNCSEPMIYLPSGMPIDRIGVSYVSNAFLVDTL